MVRYKVHAEEMRMKKSRILFRFSWSAINKFIWLLCRWYNFFGWNGWMCACFACRTFAECVHRQFSFLTPWKTGRTVAVVNRALIWKCFPADNFEQFVWNRWRRRMAQNNRPKAEQHKPHKKTCAQQHNWKGNLCHHLYSMYACGKCTVTGTAAAPHIAPCTLCNW